jgi:hypothetical protein
MRDIRLQIAKADVVKQFHPVQILVQKSRSRRRTTKMSVIARLPTVMTNRRRETLVANWLGAESTVRDSPFNEMVCRKNRRAW